MKRTYKGAEDYLLVAAADILTSLADKALLELGIHAQTDCEQGSGYEQYLLCFSRAFAYRSAQLQDKLDLSTR